MFNVIKPSLKAGFFAAVTASLARYSSTFKVAHDSYNLGLKVYNGVKIAVGIASGQQTLSTKTDYVDLSLKLAMHSAKIAGYLVKNSIYLALGCSAATAVSYAASCMVDSQLDKINKRLDQLQEEDKSLGNTVKNSEDIKNLTSTKAQLESLKYYVDGAYDNSLEMTKYFVSLYLMNKAQEYVEKVMSDFNNSRKKAADQAKEAEQPKEQKLAQDGQVERPKEQASDKVQQVEEHNKAAPPQDGQVEQPKQMLDKAKPLRQQEPVLLAQKQEVPELQNEVVAQHKEQVSVEVMQVEHNKPMPAQAQPLEQQNHALVIQTKAMPVQEQHISAVKEQPLGHPEQSGQQGYELLGQEQALSQLQYHVAQQGHALSVQAQHMLAQAQQLVHHHQLALELQAAQPVQYVEPLVAQPPLPPVVKSTLVSVVSAQVDNPEASFEPLFPPPSSPLALADPQPLEDLVSSAKAMSVNLFEASEELLDSYQVTIRYIAPDKVQGEHGVTGLKYLNNILFSTPQGTNEHTMVYVDPVYPLGEVMQFLPNMVLKSNL